MFGVPIRIESSTIESIRWDASALRLEVTFKIRPNQTSKSVYVYSNIDLEVINNFLGADSKGRFFHNNIKTKPDKYPCQKVNSIHIESTDTSSSKDT